MNTKTCTKCNDTLPMTEFYDNNRSWCKACIIANNKARSLQNKADYNNLQKRQEIFADSLPLAIRKKLAYARKLVAQAQQKEYQYE